LPTRASVLMKKRRVDKVQTLTQSLSSPTRERLRK